MREILSRADRLILCNQLQIIEMLAASSDAASQVSKNGFDPSDCAYFRQVLTDGHHHLIEEILESVHVSSLTYEQEAWALDVLDFYLHMQSCFENLHETSGLSKEDVSFRGWNSGKGFLGFARLYCFRSGLNEPASRFERLWPSPAFDAHGNPEEGYERMLLRAATLGVYEDGNPIKAMMESDIIDVLSSFQHPE